MRVNRLHGGLKRGRTAAGVLTAAAASILLTYLTVLPPVVNGDWSRLDPSGQYLPQRLDYAWPDYGLQLGLWMCLLTALWWAFRLPTQQRVRQHTIRRVWMLIPLIIVGFGLRLHKLGGLPLLVDEIGFAARAADMLHGQRIPIFAPAHNGNPAVFSWLLADVMAVLGQNRFAARLVSVIVGTLTIPAAYSLGRNGWSWRVGAAAAAFLATYPAHVHFSRLALYNSVDPLFSLLALAALARAWRANWLPTYAWVGIWAGIAQYFYHGARLLPVLVALCLTAAVVQRKAHAWRAIGVTLLTFSLITLPRFAPAITAGLPVTGNLEAMRLPADLADNLLRAALAWIGQPDRSLFWLSDAPLLPYPALLAGVGGLLLCLRHPADGRHALLLMMLALTTIFGGAIWTAAPLYVRYMTALPAIVLLVALPFEHLVVRARAGSYAFSNRLWLLWACLAVIVLYGAAASIQHTLEANRRVPAGLWEADSLARAAAGLPDGLAARFRVSDAFGEVERIVIADYVAFYGQRRALSVLVK